MQYTYSSDTISAEKYWGASDECIGCPYESDCETECRKEDARESEIDRKLDKLMEGQD
ncbi:MAG: hypothetical protein M0R49_08085 [Limnochordia bacterium]|nr:hypothetical protein [Limnochordia bacterium]